MKDVTVYQAPLVNGTLQYDWSAGDHNLQATLQWPIVEQEQWDIMEMQLNQLAADDPLIVDGKYVRQYDYVSYYLDTVPQQQVDREEWWAEQTNAPATLFGKSYEEIANTLQERVILCQGFRIYLNELLEDLHYRCTIVDETGEVTTCCVIPGAFAHNQDNNWAIRFLADVDDIGRDQLGIVTVEVESYDEPSS